MVVRLRKLCVRANSSSRLISFNHSLTKAIFVALSNTTSSLDRCFRIIMAFLGTVHKQCCKHPEDNSYIIRSYDTYLSPTTYVIGS